MKGRFKSLFVRKSSNSTSASDDKNSKEFFFSNEILEDINKRNSIAHRCRTLKELGEIVLTKEIEEHAIEAIWKEIEDLFQPSVNIEGRQTALEFMISLVRGQYKNLGLLRVQFFRLIENHDVNEDLCSRVTLLNCLTENGKDISYYEQIGTFLLQFMSKALLSEKTNDFLLLLVNVIRFNSSFLDKETICSLVKKTCEFCHVANTELEVESCLSLLDVAVKYGGLPPEGLCPLIVTLCRTVNIKNFSQPSWKLMRSLIGTTFGHTVLNLMCCILEDNNNVTDLTLLRGAVFFIGMSIWGSQRVTSLRYQPLHVLPAFKISLQCANFVVAHEVGVSLLRLVNKFGPSQDLITWDIIMDILEILLKVIESLNGGDSQLLSGNVQSILSAIENLYTKNMMRGSVSRFFSIVESCSEDRPESSIITLLTYYEEQITPTRDDWFELFRRVLDNYLKKEKRTSIRVRVIEMITFVFSHHKHKYEDELIELFLKNYISAVVLEKDNEVRLVISQLLANLLQICSSVQYSALLQVVDELLSSLSNQRENLQDIEIIVDALIKTYKNKLFCPQSMFVVNIFTLLVKHVSRYYLINLPPLIGGNIRCKIFAAILSMRANSNHFVGVADGDTIAKYSAHTIFKSVNKEVAGCGEIWTICCDFQIAFDAILTCLKNELDWSVLEFVLKNLPHQLKNKSLFIYCQCNMNKLCAALSNLINDKMYLNKVQNCPATFGISELRNLIFPILSIVATYHSYLSKEQQFELLKCLEFGLNTVCAKTCVSCLTICTLEMQSVMIRVLPSILVKLSQISATVPMAVPVLQFLSTLKEISSLYANFVEEQYMSIFAMALPYTDIFKYSIYVVTLAHQVIADWFTRCRLAFRKGFVTLIAKALKSNIKTTSDKKDESYTRKCILHEHMTEVCLDMMARYSFSNHLCQPQRSPVINYLLDKGDSQTWLLSNMLITITTSCGSQEKCLYCSSNKSSIKKNELPTKKKETCNNMQEVFLNIQSTPTTPKVINSQVSLNKITLESIPVVTASSCQQAYDGNQSSCEEEGTEDEVTPLVVKVAQELVQYQDQVYSPSEQLLFSRQVSKVCTNEKEDMDIDHYDYNHDDDDYDNNDDGEFSVLNKNENKLENEVLQFYIDETQCIKNYTQNVSVKEKEPIVSPILSSNYNKLPEIPFIKLDHEKKNPANAKHNRVGECKCISEGWAEVYIRRPTGNVSWIMRIENNLNLPPCTLSELSLLASSLEGHSLKEKLSYQHSIRQRSSHSRSYSTGSIEIVKSKGSSFTDDVAWSLNQEDNLQELTERFAKAPLTKSMSNPKNVEQGLTAEETKTFYSRYRAFSAVEPVTNDNMNNVQCEERGPNNGISPYFIFLQLFYSTLSCFSDKIPLLLDHSEVIDRAVHILDRIPTFNTHKFGVLFVDRGQEKSEVEILSNEFGSTRYTDFISGLGELVQLHECISNGIFTGGMDCSGADGKLAYTWKDDTTQVIFHVATLMPNKERDSQCYSKKLHIGNNFVTIIYDESKFGYTFGTIKGQMSLAEILIRPLDYNSNVVTIRIKDNCDAGVMHNHPFIISDQNLPVLVRQLAINTNMAIVTELSEKTTTNAFASNWLERLLQINRIKSKATPQKPSSNYEDARDFVNYT
ncbi:tuberin isoform X2 [Hydra vulgaris]|uniref:tuberin isoform X2 n=1 Tax=Hydra vulgaris TaxID=6087 RepID=UPI001F5ED39D|nr:tuberin isoform X2 [Hydra vulgaris]